MRLWTLNTFVFASGYAWLVVGSFFWRDRMIGALTAIARRPRPARRPAAAGAAGRDARGIARVRIRLLGLALRCSIAFPALWEFHKVHHSAEVMTTFTEMRQHPVEIIFFMNVIALCTGLTFGLMTYLFGPGTWAT